MASWRPDPFSNVARYLRRSHNPVGDMARAARALERVAPDAGPGAYKALLRTVMGSADADEDVVESDTRDRPRRPAQRPEPIRPTWDETATTVQIGAMGVMMVLRFAYDVDRVARWRALGVHARWAAGKYWVIHRPRDKMRAAAWASEEEVLATKAARERERAVDDAIWDAEDYLLARPQGRALSRGPVKVQRNTGLTTFSVRIYPCRHREAKIMRGIPGNRRTSEEIPGRRARKWLDHWTVPVASIAALDRAISQICGDDA